MSKAGDSIRRGLEEAVLFAQGKARKGSTSPRKSTSRRFAAASG
jgi:hypothetical protein